MNIVVVCGTNMLFPSHPNSLGFGFVYARLWDEYAFPFSSQLSTIGYVCGKINHG